MTPAGLKRKRQFMAALAYKGETKYAWADRHNVHVTHLTRVLAEGRESHRLMAEVDQTIRAFLKDACQDYKRVATV